MAAGDRPAAEGISIMTPHSHARNGLLARLSTEDLALLEPLLQPVMLKQRDVLFEPFRKIEHVYFFEGGLSSEIAENPDAERIEVGCVGYEGLSGVPVLLGVDSTPHQAFMQAGGSAQKIRTQDLRMAMEASATLRALLLRYAHVFMVQIAATALADGRYRLEQRLARWLLMCHDRLDDDLPLTHEFLALMLGVRRSSVTDGLHLLEGSRLIKAARGLVTVRDRPGLEKLAGKSYGMPEQEYRRLLGGVRQETVAG
jgi:CRP-like cAMP-binding protein